MNKNFTGTLYEHVEHELKQLVSNKIKSMRENPEDYFFIQGFIHLPLMPMVGQSSYNTQVISIGLMNKYTYELKLFSAHNLLKNIFENREKSEKATRCTVTDISKFKDKKETNT